MVDLKLDYGKDFLKEEVRCDYTIDSEMKRIWAVELDLVNELKRVCDKYGIQYFADGGTLLGAIRHKGFIPWDNDIDLCMFRDQYEKLCEVAPREFKHPYFFQTEYTDPTSLRGHAQLRNSETTGAIRIELNKTARLNQGIFIDIFPLDNVPKLSSPLQTWQGTKMRILRGTLSQKMGTAEANSFAAKVLRFASHFVTRDFLFRCINKNYVRYNSPDNPYIVCLASYYKVQKETFPKEAFGEPVRVPFEDGMFPVPQDTDLILTTIYGDYMTPPPPEKRVIKHHF